MIEIFKKIKIHSNHLLWDYFSSIGMQAQRFEGQILYIALCYRRICAV